MAIYSLHGVAGVTFVAGVTDRCGSWCWRRLEAHSRPGAPAVRLPRLFCSTTSSTAEGELTLRLPSSAFFHVTRFTVHVKSRYLGVIPTVSVTRINMH